MAMFSVFLSWHWGCGRRGCLVTLLWLLVCLFPDRVLGMIFFSFFFFSLTLKEKQGPWKCQSQWWWTTAGKSPEVCQDHLWVRSVRLLRVILGAGMTGTGQGPAGLCVGQCMGQAYRVEACWHYPGSLEPLLSSTRWQSPRGRHWKQNKMQMWWCSSDVLRLMSQDTK